MSADLQAENEQLRASNDNLARQLAGMSATKVAVQASPGVWECGCCDYPITWDGGFEQWVHWWNGSTMCKKEEA
ncbi:hypothetical protein [Arthrobacter sp. StoSoilB13]|uniref:hypothetical protein n=1 Tax=Arthrobacter sp. StoSoilB13 TaxID=2830993 RepID=UPI001CC6DBDF|nr:hypothetical protein [Arthrobacter sp. StoSoilB13]BCW47961.1 hypothetical protein StoSoilB13_03030 [Arthrobacter sp. StoSoilB13]